MKSYHRILGVASVALAVAFAGGCGDDTKDSKDTSKTDTVSDTVSDTGGTDTADNDTTGDDTSEADTADTNTVPTTYATLTFAIDDTGTQTYDAADGLAWKGSFSYDETTNVATFTGASWPGPYIPLYDDGPPPTGHEPEGAVAGDHIWSVAVKTPTPTVDEVFEYGAVQGYTGGTTGDWIWPFPANGTFTVPAGSTGTIAATGFAFAAHGNTDLRLTLDVSNEGANLDPNFQGVAYTDVKVKGSSWAWVEIPMSDDGTHGDETAGDGIFTFVLSENLSKHVGLLAAGTKAQFIFVLGNTEYLGADGASTAGVTAELREGVSGTWSPATIDKLPDGNQNTYVTAPELTFVPPADTVAVNFTVDDTANKSYGESDGLAWKGSFNFDETTRVISYDADWKGPWALLYDDGPWSEGGHEPAGATAGDHIWGVTAWVSNAADATFGYGAVRGFTGGSSGDWIWRGDNGSFTVTMGATTPIDAAGLVLPLRGTTDLKLTLDVSGDGANLNATFQGINYTVAKVKGSAWGWGEIDMVDDGTKGDETAGDGIFTFTLSENTNVHDGLLTDGQVAEFVFVLPEYTAVENHEYKAGNVAATEGVGAYMKPDGGSFSAATISVQSTGNHNTYVTAP